MTVGEAVPIATAGDVLDLIGLPALMARTSGHPDIAIALVDGPVLTSHPDLAADNIREIAGAGAACAGAESLACQHGTFVAGILSARRGGAAPAICPDCVLLVRPIFFDSDRRGTWSRARRPRRSPAPSCRRRRRRPSRECQRGARRDAERPRRARARTGAGSRRHRGVIVVAAAGNQGVVGGTALTQHRAVIAVSACGRSGSPLSGSNLGRSIGQRGLRAPGEDITSLGTDTHTVSSGGTSVAAPFVTGALALAWSQCPRATAGQVRLAVALAHSPRRRTVVPALLNACAIHAALDHLVRHG